jgi:hypothetical protein
MNRDERVYRVMLRIYPRQFLDAYQNEMIVAFRDQRRDARGGHTPWAQLLVDLARSAPTAWRDQLDDDLHTGGGAMKTMAILAISVGIYETLNTIYELSAGGLGGRGGLVLLGLILAATIGVVLAGSGIALIRRGRAAARFATAACIACFVIFAATGMMRAGLSGLATVAGLAFPIILLAFLILNRSARTVL